MKIIFEYHLYQHENKLSDICMPMNINNEKEKILCGYLDDCACVRLVGLFLDSLYDRTLQKDDISTEAWEAMINGDMVEMNFEFLSEEEKEDKDNILLIPRKELAYALEKWKVFLQREPEADYQEIIDTEDVYKNEERSI